MNNRGKNKTKTLITIFTALGIVLFCCYLYSDNRPVMKTGYNYEIETGGIIEETYLHNDSYETKKLITSWEKPIGRFTIYYPKELEKSDAKYPMILFCNGTGWKASRFEAELAQMASWGFIVVGTQDKNAEDGESTMSTLLYMRIQNNSRDSIFFNKIDTSSVGLVGFSQGGGAVFNVLNELVSLDRTKYIKAAVMLSWPSEKEVEDGSYPFDTSLVKCPILLLAGTEDDSVVSFEEMQDMYERIGSSKAMARRVGMEHDDMMYKAGGYMMAWFCWQLKDDQYASKVFTGDSPEILSNPLYQDQRIDVK